jgi:hypothetical protein
MSKHPRGSVAPPPPSGPLLRLSDIAAERGISVSRLRAAISAGRLRAFKVGDARNSHWGVAEADLNQFLASRASSPGGAA